MSEKVLFVCALCAFLGVWGSVIALIDPMVVAARKRKWVHVTFLACAFLASCVMLSFFGGEIYDMARSS